VSNSEKIGGGLIVNEVLLQGERQLLRDRNSAQQDPRGAPPPPAAPPISHSDKTMAPVLLTLLDEQLNGTIAEEAGRTGAREGEIASSPNRVAARYAEDDRVFRADPPPSNAALPQGQAYPHITQSGPSLDALQRSVSANTRNQQVGGAGPHSGEAHRTAGANSASSPSPLKVAGIVLGVAAVVMLVAAKCSR